MTISVNAVGFRMYEERNGDKNGLRTYHGKNFDCKISGYSSKCFPADNDDPLYWGDF